MIRLDIGCGPNKKADHVGIDQYAFPGVDHVLDASRERLPFEDGTVEEVWSSHFLEHLTPMGRCHLANELYRVMKPGSRAIFIVPHWSSCRAYGDPTHQWPPVSEMWALYLNKDWRNGNPNSTPPMPANAPHTDKKYLPWGYDCDFDSASGACGFHAGGNGRSQEWLQFGVTFYKELITDMQIVLTRRG